MLTPKVISRLAARRLKASLSRLGSTIANSYLKFEITCGIAAADENKIKIAKTSLGYNLVRIGVMANGISWAINAPLNNVNTFLKNSFCRIFLNRVSKLLQLIKNSKAKIKKD